MEVTDPVEAEAKLPQLSLDVIGLGSERFFAKRVVLDLDGCLLVYHFSAHPIRSRSQLPGPHQVVAVFSPKTAGSLNGRTITPDLMATGHAGAETETVAGSHYRALLFFVPRPEVEIHLTDEGPGPHFLAGETAVVRRTYQWGRSVIRAAEQSPRVFDDSDHVRTGVRRELIDRLGDTLSTTSSFVARDDEVTTVNRSRLVRKVQDWAVDHVDEHVYLKDLCRVAQVSERALRNAFQDVLGMSPVAFLSRLRLHRVRKALKRARPGETTVTAEATRWGFWHAGEFSKAYKALFHESPSDTLTGPR